MTILTYLSLFVCLAVTVQGYRFSHAAGDQGNEEWGVHQTNVDHFDSTNTDLYEQRYLSNMEFAKDQDPVIIIYVGGEWEITTGQLGPAFQLYFIAKENKGALFNLEHRFFGKSMPKKDYSTENLKLLTTDQAQADLIAFIKMLKSKPQFTNSKVLLFGCSYSATLVTWTRHDHSDEIDMIYATSGPQHAQSDMNTYADKASLVINAINSKCGALLEEASQQLVNMFNEENGDKKVRQLFKYCDPAKPDAKLDRMVVFEDMVAYWGNGVQTDRFAVERDCQTILNDNNGTSLEKYARLRTKDQSGCVAQNYYANLKTYKNPSTDEGALRPFFYMQCKMFGWFLTSTKTAETPNLFLAPNEVSTLYYHSLCKEAFSNTITKEDTESAIAATNQKYGGHTPDVTKAIFVHGGLDPWEPMGVKSNYSDGIVYHYVGSAGHCHDMYAPSPNDDQFMAPVKASVRAQLQTWVNE